MSSSYSGYTHDVFALVHFERQGEVLSRCWRVPSLGPQRVMALLVPRLRHELHPGERLHSASVEVSGGSLQVLGPDGGVPCRVRVDLVSPYAPAPLPDPVDLGAPEVVVYRASQCLDEALRITGLQLDELPWGEPYRASLVSERGVPLSVFAHLALHLGGEAALVVEGPQLNGSISAAEGWRASALLLALAAVAGGGIVQEREKALLESTCRSGVPSLLLLSRFAPEACHRLWLRLPGLEFQLA